MPTRTHAVEDRARPHPGGAPRRSDAPVTGSLVALQRSAGNRAVGGMLRGGRSMPVVQRAPVTYGSGLDNVPDEDTYLKEAVKLWTTKKTKGMALTTFATTLFSVIAGELATHGIPAVKFVFDPALGAAGLFDSEHWTLKVNKEHFGAKKGASTLRDLKAAEVIEVVGTLYHEARHADQDTLLIRVRLGRGQTVDDIVKATKIDRSAVDAIKNTTYADTPTATDEAFTDRMFDVMYGPHNELLTFLATSSQAFSGLDTLALKGSKLADAKAHVDVFADWQKKVLAPKLQQLNALRAPTQTLTDLKNDLTAVDTSLSTFLAAWSTATGPKATKAQANAARAAAGVVVKKVMAAYQNLEGEKDAFRVEDDVKDEFKKRVPGIP